MNIFRAEVNKIILALISVGILILLMFPVSLSANHFRYGTMSWELVSDNDATHREIRLKLESGWRRGYASLFETVGSVASGYISINWGDGSSAEAVKIKVLSSDADSNSAIVEMGTGTASSWSTGATHSYPDNGTYVITWGSNARIGGIENMDRL